MNWKYLHDKILDIDDTEDVDYTQNNDKLENYKLISRNNIDDLEFGMYIKYIKNEYDDSGKIIENICSGGFLVGILNGDKIYKLLLQLKTGDHIWNLKFIKYKIYGKSKKLFKSSNKNILRDIYKNEIAEINKKSLDEQNKKINEIIKNKHKHEILFRDDNNI